MRNNQSTKLIIMLLVACISFGIKYYNRSNRQTANNYIPPINTTQTTTTNTTVDNSVLNRHPSHLIYTHHAHCRMGCRHFDESEVNEILANGKINVAKSNENQGDCPTFALEGVTHDGQHARMVFAACNPDEVKVVTVIDLDTEWPCDCK